VFVLKPNPNYHGSRPQALDAIVYRTGIDFGKAVAQVGQGKVDYVQDRDPALAPTTLAARRAGLRFRLTANNSTDRLALNTSRPLFADPSMRRAVAYALDRSALARAMEDGDFRLPTQSLLPPNLSKNSDSMPVYSSRADLRNARTFVRGRHAELVLATGAPATGGVFDPSFVEAVRTQLAEIGLTVRVVPLRQDATPAQRAAVLANADMARVETSQGDVDDAVGFLLRLPYMPDVAAKRLDAIAALPTSRRAAVAARLARRLQQEAVYLGIADSATPELVSARLGCVIDQPQYPGVDLAALCLQKTRG
jgi:ABC-type transport system substrate-binding protein